MENDTAHNLSEFGSFPWGKLEDAIRWRDIASTGEQPEFQVGGVSCGGILAGVDFNPRKPHIDFTRPDASVDAWEIPESLGVLVDEYYKRGTVDRECEIRMQAKSLVALLLGS